MKAQRCADSLRASADENDRDGAEEDLDIEPKRPVVDVLEVEAHPVGEFIDLIAAADLPQAGEAGLDAEAAAMGEILEAPGLVHWQGPRADEAHGSLEDVEQLGQFVEAEPPQEAADRRDARIVGDLEHRATHLVHGRKLVLALLGVGDHRAEFIHGERSPVDAASFLAKQNRAGRVELHGQGAQQQHRREKYEHGQRPDGVDGLLCQALQGGGRCGVKHQQRDAVKIIDRGAGDLSVEKIGGKPHLNALELAGVYDLLDLVELGVTCVDENDIGGVLMHLSQEIVDRFAVDVELQHDAVARVVGVVDAAEHVLRFLRRAEQDDSFLEVGAGQASPLPTKRAFLLGPGQRDAEPGKNQDHRASKLNLEGEHHRDDEQCDQHGGLG